MPITKRLFDFFFFLNIFYNVHKRNIQSWGEELDRLNWLIYSIHEIRQRYLYYTYRQQVILLYFFTFPREKLNLKNSMTLLYSLFTIKVFSYLSLKHTLKLFFIYFKCAIFNFKYGEINLALPRIIFQMQ